MKNQPRYGSEPIKLVLIDVVGFTRSDRTVEDMFDIVSSLNLTVERALAVLGLKKNNLILLPTGDGICIVIRKAAPFDIHIQLATEIAKRTRTENVRIQSNSKRYELRIAVNEGEDIVFMDINRRKNIAGMCINDAARIINACGPGKVVVGDTVYSICARRQGYQSKFVAGTHLDKADVVHKYYEFTPTINAERPKQLSDLNGLFVVYRDAAGNHRFRLEAKSGQTLLGSENYASRSAVENAIESVKVNGAVDERYIRHSGQNGFMFSLKAANGQIIGLSQVYSTEKGRDGGIAAVKSIVSHAVTHLKVS